MTTSKYLDLNLEKIFHQTQTHMTISYLGKLDPKLFSYFLRKITKKLQTTKKLKGLTLDLRNIKLNPNDIKDLCKDLLKPLHDLENLKVILTAYTDPWDRFFSLFLKALKGFRNLKTFEISVPGKGETRLKPQLEALIKTLKNSNPRLQNAKFAFDLKHWPIFSEFPTLQDWGLERLRCLRKLTLFLPVSAFLEKKNDPKLALSAFKRMGRLKFLDITLVESYYREPEPLSDELAMDPKRLFPNLKSFKCGAVCRHPNYWKGLELCASKIAAGLADLEEFELRFKQDSEPKDQKIQTTTQLLASLNTDLTHFTRTFSGGKLTSNGANALISALSGPRLRNLQALTLKFSHSRGVNNEFLTRLGETIGCHLNQVKFLNLFFLCHQSGSRGLMEILKALVGDEGITDRGMSNLGKGLLRGCGNLELLSLEFWENWQISDQGAKSLCESLGKIESLKKVWLRFRCCQKVSEMSEQYALEKLGDKKEVKFARS